jgi:hypothetical protein
MNTTDKVYAATGGLNLSGVLFIVFLVLKLTGHIDWSWWWVTAPLWGGLVLLGAAVIALGVVGLVLFAIERAQDKKTTPRSMRTARRIHRIADHVRRTK